MKSCKEIREIACEQLRGNWTMPVVATLIVGILGCTTSIPFIGFLLLLVLFPIDLGYAIAHLRFHRGEKEKVVENMFSVFQNFGRSLCVPLLMAVFVMLWSLLLLIPGIIKAYSYAMTYFIANDNPELGANACIERSMKMMEGHKMELFLLDLSFIGWILLAIITFGIGIFWVQPYITVAHAEFYEELKSESAQEPVAEVKIA